MSGLALSLQQLGAICAGSDAVGSEIVEALEEAGIAVSLEQSAGALPQRCDLVIASAAIPCAGHGPRGARILELAS